MPKINVLTRIQEILGTDILQDAEIFDYETGSFSYSVEDGYERCTYRHSSDWGSVEYAGPYHPDGVCEGGGVCKYCGRTL